MNQIQTSVLIDNEWVSRPLDVYQLMAQARDSDGEMPEATVRSPKEVPELGVLSRTLFASPLFKAIRPANIRHKDLNDIVLVSEDSIQLKEIHHYGHLRHVATKSDFKGRIHAARVFGNPREVPVSVGSPLPKEQALNRGRRPITGDEGVLLPPEVMVLTLTSRTLMFLWAQHTSTGAVSFSQRTLRLPAGISQFDRFGAFLAIDPKCRAMAVAAQESRFILYKTKSMQKWRKNIRDGTGSTPIEDERIIHIEGRIMHMEFLSSASGQDDYHVVLLFVVVLQGKTKITCFDWDCRQDLGKATARTERVLVDFAYRDVLKRSSIWVAWDKAPRNPDFPKEAFYVAREDGRIIYVERGPADGVETEGAGDWPCRVDTAFACLSVDNSEFSQLYPDVLIAGGAGSDGLLCKVGSWPAESPYALSYLGTNQFSIVESISSWVPVMDLSIARLSGARASHERDRSSIFVANGSGPHGEISELRHGLQSNVDDSFGGVGGTTGLWLVDHSTQTIEIDGKPAKQHSATFTLTLPLETLLLRLVRTQCESGGGEFSGAWEDGVWKVEQLNLTDDIPEDGVLRDVETMAACPWNNDLAVQVTHGGIRLLQRPGLQQVDCMAYPHSLLLSACKSGFPFIATVLREDSQTYLEAVRISHDGHLVRATDQNTGLKLDCDPTCIELFDYEGIPCVFLSTFDSKVSLFRVDATGHLMPLGRELELPKVDGDNMLLEGAALLSTEAHSTLVCATRRGYLLSHSLSSSSTSRCQLSYRYCVLMPSGASGDGWQVLQMGTTSVKIIASSTDTSTAFVSCGADFCRVRCSASNPTTIEIDSIWFNHRTNPGYLQSPVTAAYQLPFDRESDASGRNIGGFMFVVAGDDFLFSQLDADIGWASQDSRALPRDDCRTVPRKLLTQSKPTSVTYIKAIRKLLVATMEAKQKRPPPDGYRVLHSTISLLDAQAETSSDEPELKQEGNVAQSKHVTAQYSLQHGERVYSITEWPFVDHRKKKYTLIIIGTGIPGGSGKETGRRWIFSTGKNGSKLDRLKQSDVDYPVYCTARATVDLPSPGVHITIRAPFVYVSTLQHSHLCFEVVEAAQEGRYEFEKVFTDSRERRCASHLVCDVEARSDEYPEQSTVVLVTDKSSASVTGLYHPPERTYKNAADTVFEACLPHTVVRIVQGDIRPPWRRPRPSTNPRGGGVLVDDIIGACSDGTLYTFSILDEPARHLLRLLQNIIEEKEKRNPANQETSINTRGSAIFDVLRNGAEGNQDDKIRAMDVDPRQRERGPGGPRHKHIDGDLVGTWLNESGDLVALLRDGTEENVVKLFGEFVKVLWGDEITSSEQGVVKVKSWLDEVFMPLL
ncbi:hypothetical protein EK21DRAFT_69951 [Setomelanomma holmii]|uniref:RSE1/DDB1/CPSF1 first beta-propeller domain-containing protein n=1 Tax=Setomelanomma holmii TaxID=210430 RepID=A0A9P4LK47_9PLEO|nr:hypothetical protein EK21DRAFT_69951 [Setomelanomma holmii]